MGQATSERVEQLHGELERAVDQLVTGEDWVRMLETASRFHRYSPNNVMLIMVQRPDATRVAGYQTWKTFGRQVRRGEHGIRILAPCVYRNRDDATGEDVAVVRGFKTSTVFDVAQTDGADLPDEIRPMLLDGDSPAGLWDALAAMVAEAGYTLERGDCRGANGVTLPAERIVRVRADVDDAQACKTLAHELAHIRLGHCGPVGGTLTYVAHRGVCEVEAESVAFIVCAASGMATDGYTLPYVARWAGGDADVVRDTAQRVIGVARAILAALEVGEDTEAAA